MSTDMPAFLLRNLLLSLDEDEAFLSRRLAERFALRENDVVSCRIVRKGIDARKKSAIRHVYTVEFTVADPELFWRRSGGDRDLERVPHLLPEVFTPVVSRARIIIVGSGPAGLFAALRLAEYGLRPLLIERGREMDGRVKDVGRFWQDGELDEESNIQFGEGGAGTFSDGKLTTRVRDPHSGYV
ncbi:MAG TPA: NAD(P)-binding protein, partial [Geobacteraceae bacterium]|nr:NAD(P)-binding protein [Geobacteraceae bacterium]